MGKTIPRDEYVKQIIEQFISDCTNNDLPVERTFLWDGRVCKLESIEKVESGDDTALTFNLSSRKI